VLENLAVRHPGKVRKWEGVFDDDHHHHHHHHQIQG
jgi:hypothetical protein